MDNTFDDLFGKFFNGEEKPKTPPVPKTPPAPKPTAKRRISKLKQIENDLDSAMSSQSGIPDNLDSIIQKFMSNGFEMEASDKKSETIEYYEEDGQYFKKITWKLDGGEMVKIIISDEPFVRDEIIDETPKEKSLDILLEEAIANEDYETAATLRDKLKKTKKNTKK